MILEPINLEMLLSLRLVGTAQAPHGERACRIVELKVAEHESDLVLRIASGDGADTAISVPFRRAAEAYLVEPAAEHGEFSGRSPVCLRKYLFQLHHWLLWHWPNHSLQQQFLEHLLAPPPERVRDAESRPRGFRHAARWLRLDSLRASLSPKQSTRDLFVLVKQQLKANRRLLASPFVSSIRSDAWNPVLSPAPTPGSLLPAMRTARSDARSSAAFAEPVAINLSPYVAAALENHWARIFHEDPVVRSAWGQTSTTVRASLQVAANSPEFSTAALEHQVSHPWDAGCRIELRVPFEARPHPDQNVGGCEAIITVIGGTAVDPGWGKRIPPLLRQLEFHLGDTLWSLDEFFREHCLTVSSVERLVFRDQEELAQWLSPSANDEEEERIRRLSHSWMHSGGPLRLDGDAAATRRQVGQWLIRLQGSARTASPSVGESRPGRSPATARQPKDRRVRITITFTR